MKNFPVRENYILMEVKNDDLLEICKIIFTTDTFIKTHFEALKRFMKKCLKSSHHDLIEKYLKSFEERHKNRWGFDAK